MTELDFSEEDVLLYFKAVFGELPARDENGHFRLDCPFPFHPGGFVYMDPTNGQFHCRGGCGRGELAIFHMAKAKIFGFREARQAVLRIIKAEKEKARLADQAAKERALLAEREAKAAREKALAGLPDDVKKLVRKVDRHPGKSRRWLQQCSHLYGREFGKAIRCIERGKLVAWQDVLRDVAAYIDAAVILPATVQSRDHRVVSVRLRCVFAIDDVGKIDLLPETDVLARIG